ncbi:hypothetical protein B0H14DRAFT_2418019 [Mycena olivaceomarginata]|nr:hypothetical protein B0H14DRAFT_2418019 [Mycena olivaceomarginata]
MNSAITPTAHPALNRFLLPTQEYVSCVLWNGLYHITGTDIVRALVFRFEVSLRLGLRFGEVGGGVCGGRGGRRSGRGKSGAWAGGLRSRG